jgi:alkylmercury lyase-like protein
MTDIDAITGSVTSQRRTAVSAPARDLHRTILRAFATTGAAPRRSELGRDIGALLAELADTDVIGLDTAGEIAYAYPFAVHPTPHRVHLAGGVSPYAMCAIDALGIPTMLGTDAVITSRDPRTGEPITVTVTGRGATADWQPDSAVVLAATRDHCRTTTSAESCCGTINFFSTRSHAQAWAADHPELSGVVLDQDRALAVGIRCFGTLLAP